MTIKQFYEYALIEQNKVQAPNFLLEDFVYLANKAIGQYINKMYNLYEINQQKSDDLRVLKSTAILIPGVSADYSTTSLLNKTYQVNLPDDYLHILNCVVEYLLVPLTYKCYSRAIPIHIGAKRMTADMFPSLITNYYQKPKYNNPYFYINNVALDTFYPIVEVPTRITPIGTFLTGAIISHGTIHAVQQIDPLIVIKDGLTYSVVYSNVLTLQTALTTLGITSTISNNNNVLTLSNLYLEGVSSILSTGNYLNVTLQTNTTDSLIERVSDYRYGNKSKVRMEIRYGNDNSIFTLNKVYIDYLRSPQYVKLTQTQIDEVSDTSQLLEFPDYVCQEILNELVKLLMENTSDPRLQTHIPVNQSIAGPGR